MANIVEIRGLSKSYGDFSLSDVNLTLPEGSILGLVGANGAGKTTTIKLILNLIKRDAGSIKIFGQDSIAFEKEIKRDLGVVFDESYFHDNLRTGDISKIMGNIFENWDDKLFSKYLKRFSLPTDKTVKQYSRGMKMKLSIIAALSHHPKLLLLDEPTGGLDPIVRNEILDLFLEFIQDEKRSILLSSHITGDLERIADYIAFIDRGKIVFSRQKDELLSQYGIMRCCKEHFAVMDKADFLSVRENEFGMEILVKNLGLCRKKYPEAVFDRVSIDQIMLFLAKGAK